VRPLPFLCALLLPLVAGCGGGGGGSSATVATHAQQARRPSVCIAGVQGVVARAASGSAASVKASTSTGNNAMPQCSFRTSLADGKRLLVIANVDSSPQPFQRLERAIEEATQQFGSVREYAAPQRVAKLGLDASWFPEEHQLLTGDNRQLLTISVKWPGSSVAHQRALAAAVARTYLAHRPPPAG
jgi:hypothetical protein